MPKDSTHTTPQQHQHDHCPQTDIMIKFPQFPSTQLNDLATTDKKLGQSGSRLVRTLSQDEFLFNDIEDSILNTHSQFVLRLLDARDKVAYLVNQKGFDNFMMLCIIVNSIILAFESPRLSSSDPIVKGKGVGKV